jgi:uncharacterized protein YbaR (Trm112 family)
MIDSELMKILCCPETHQELRPADGVLLEKLNQQIAAGKLQNRAGATVKGALEGGLLRADGKYLYPVRRNLPIMLVDEAILLNSET